MQEARAVINMENMGVGVQRECTFTVQSRLPSVRNTPEVVGAAPETDGPSHQEMFMGMKPAGFTWLNTYAVLDGSAAPFWLTSPAGWKRVQRMICPGSGSPEATPLEKPVG